MTDTEQKEIISLYTSGKIKKDDSRLIRIVCETDGAGQNEWEIVDSASWFDCTTATSIEAFRLLNRNIKGNFWVTKVFYSSPGEACKIRRTVTAAGFGSLQDASRFLSGKSSAPGGNPELSIPWDAFNPLENDGEYFPEETEYYL